MRSHSAARSLLCSLAFLGALPAQRSQPRFVLPEQTLDYTAQGPAGHPALPLLTGNDTAARQQANERATLGRVLFHDRLLSRNQTRSCSSCHDQKLAFADGHARSRGFHGQLTRRNSMAIANLTLQSGGLFWDQRARSLEHLVLMPITDPIEMGLDLTTLRERIAAEADYAGLFERAFGDRSVTTGKIGWALAEFVGAIVSLRARYDEGLTAAGRADVDFPDFTAAENRGKRLFFGVDRGARNSCAICHVQRLPGICGNCIILDPRLVPSEECRNNGLDGGGPRKDTGRQGVTGKSEDFAKFRAPSLRNIELTGPYMHDGRFATLDQVLEFYAHRVRSSSTLDAALGGSDHGSGWGGQPRRSDIPGSIVGPDLGMELSQQDRADLIAFLKTLTDRELVRDPRFADPFVRPDS